MLSALFLRKPVRAREMVALALTYGGIGLVMSGAMGGENRDFALGAALVFGSALAYAVYLVAGSDVVRRVGSLRFSAWATAIASILCVAQFLVLRPLSALDLPASVFGLAAIMAVVSTVLPVFMTAEALRRLGANQVALFGALGPVSAIGLANLGLEETLSWVQVVGAALVLGGVLLVTLKPRA
jgi:drug/metabolite transporter (DMT)-like permease